MKICSLYVYEDRMTIQATCQTVNLTAS